MVIQLNDEPGDGLTRETRGSDCNGISSRRNSGKTVTAIRSTGDQPLIAAFRIRQSNRRPRNDRSRWVCDHTLHISLAGLRIGATESDTKNPDDKDTKAQLSDRHNALPKTKR